MSVKPKKHLGQHFLKDDNIAFKIANTLILKGYTDILEIGPGMGVLTKHLLNNTKNIHVIEIDAESVNYLNQNYPELKDRIYQEDFLKFDILKVLRHQPFAIIGNFPYNISTQIVFKTLALRDYVPEFSGMFQKEVAERICAKEGSKTYGILSVLTQAFYNTNYLFTVPPSVFKPPPKVNSGVIHLIRKDNYQLPCNETLLFKIVKTAFQQRRKTLRNSLKIFNLSSNLNANTIFDQRPEQLTVEEFINLTQLISKNQETI